MTVSVTIAPDTFETVTVIYTYDEVADANKVGLPLEIRLINAGLSGGYSEINFDNSEVIENTDKAFWSVAMVESNIKIGGTDAYTSS